MFSHIKELFTRPSGYTIARSVRLRSSASAYFNRTPASAGNNQKFTWSGWGKRGAISSLGDLFSAGTGDNARTFAFFQSDNTLIFGSNNSGTYYGTVTTAVFRDPSAWYHIVFSVDTTQATTANRVRIYVNGIEQTSTSAWNSGYIPQNTTTYINTTNPQVIGANPTYGIRDHYDGYLTEVNFVDGQQLTPSSFGETDSITGVWKPKKYAGTYGTNGFYLNFSDNSASTASTIGKDYSGNGNNWTPNNISVTSGVTYDSMIDVPTLWGDGSTNRGNYATLNPLLGTGSTYNPQVPTNGNLNIGGGSSKVYSAATITMTSEKWYAEFSITLAASGYPIIGVWSSVPTGTDAYPGHINSTGVSYEANGSRDVNGTNTPSWAATFTTNDIIGVACDANTGKVWFSKNGTWLASGDPANGTTPAATLTSGTYIFGPCASASSGATLSANFGQRPFTYTPPTGFVALNTNNLPVPTIKNGAGYMAATLYTGNGSTQSISNAVNGVSFQPDLVWGKSRSAATSHLLVDSVRGTGVYLLTNSTAAEGSASNTVTSFNSGGFSLGADTTLNTNASTYVGWQWKAGGSSSSNTNGSITSTVSVGATQGFSVVTYTGTGTAGTVGHGLGVTPSMIIVKKRNAIGTWFVNHSALSATQNLYLQTTDSVQSDNVFASRSSTTFGITSSGGINAGSDTFVAYCFAAVAGYSAFGSYTGNGSADGPFVFTGFRPRFVMTKRTDSTGGWVMLDSARDSYNVSGNILQAESSAAELAVASYPTLDILSNGFKIRSSTIQNASGGTYIFMAVAENPFKLSLAR